jgi:hypothetical protein
MAFRRHGGGSSAQTPADLSGAAGSLLVVVIVASPSSGIGWGYATGAGATGAGPPGIPDGGAGTAAADPGSVPPWSRRNGGYLSVISAA